MKRRFSRVLSFLVVVRTTMCAVPNVDPLDQWQVTGQVTMQAVEYGNGRFVGIGDHTYYSTNGVTWIRGADEGAGRFPAALTFGVGKFVTVDPFGRARMSEAGLAWDGVSVPLDLTAVGFGRGQFIAAGVDVDGAGMPVAVSSDAVTWKAGSLPASGSAADVVHGEGRWIIAGANPPVVSADGIHWTTEGVVNGPGALPVVHGNGVFVEAALLRVSPDGLKWEAGDDPATDLMWGVAYGNGVFVAVGNGGRVVTSPDGLTWTVRETGVTSELDCVAFGQGRFVIGGPGIVLRSGVMQPAVGAPGFKPTLCQRLPDGAMLLTVEGPYGLRVAVEASEDLVNWEEIATDPCDRGEFEVYDEAAAALPHRFYRAVRWEPPPPPTDPLLSWSVAEPVLEEGQTMDWKLAYGNAVFVAVGKKDDTRGSAWYSGDGLTWQPSNSTAPHENLAFGAGRFASWAGDLPLSTVNGQEWTEHEPIGVAVAWHMVFGRGQFSCTAPGPWDGEIWRTWFVGSSDGVNWSTNMIPPLPILPENEGVSGMSVAYARGRMVFLDSFKIVSSVDGVNWDVGPWYQPDIWAGFPPVLDYMFYGKGQFVASGYLTTGSHAGPLLFRSEDGVTWVKEELQSSQPTLATYANGTFVGESWNSSRNVSQLYGSTDGLTWTNLVELETSDRVSDLLFAEGRFYLVTREGVVWRSRLMPPHVTDARVIPELTYRLPDGAMLVTVEAPYGHEVVVEGSEDLETWQEIGRDPCDRGEFEIYHETAPPGTDWFYRARQVEP